MKQISLGKERFALVDDEDFDYLNQWKWHRHKGRHTFYARRNNGSRSYIHREILGENDSEIFIDHRDTNGLNNQRSNLRKASHRQNIVNAPSRIGKFKGVQYRKHAKKWGASITSNGKATHLGYFEKPEEAALAYNEAAKKHFGEFAYLNIVSDKPCSAGKF